MNKYPTFLKLVTCLKIKKTVLDMATDLKKLPISDRKNASDVTISN